MLFKLADTNNDNRISQKEAVDAGNLLAGGFFFRADANGDGTVTAEEARTAREALFNQRPLLRFVFQRGKSAIDEQSGNRQAGQQGGNLLSAGGNQQGGQQKLNIMNLLDSNHDGNFSAPELRQAVQTGVQSMFMMADRNGDGQLEPSEVNQAALDLGRTAVQTAFNAADSDKNGAVSEQEFDKAIMNPAHVMFKIFDANGDSQISNDEMRSGMQIIVRELRAMKVPEASNSLSNQIQQNGTAPVATSPRPATTVAPVQVAPGTVPPQR